MEKPPSEVSEMGKSLFNAVEKPPTVTYVRSIPDLTRCFSLTVLTWDTDMLRLTHTAADTAVDTAVDTVDTVDDPAVDTAVDTEVDTAVDTEVDTEVDTVDTAEDTAVDTEDTAAGTADMEGKCVKGFTPDHLTSDLMFVMFSSRQAGTRRAHTPT